MIRKEKSRFVLYSHEGKVLGRHGSYKDAARQETRIKLEKARAKGHRIPEKS